MTSLPHNLNAAASALLAGQNVVFPTETVYGLGANAWDAVACARIFEIKGRPAFNPLIVHVRDEAQLAEVVAEVPEWAHRLAAFWPGPLTLVLPKSARVPDIVTAGLPTVAVRIPANPVARALLATAGVPIAAPSANRFMSLSPTRVEDARAQLGEAVAIYVDGGPCSVGVESTILGWQDGRPVCLRPGGLALERIEAVIGKVARLETGAAIVAPGMLQKHYAPSTPTYLEAEAPTNGRRGLLTLQATATDRATYARIEELAPNGDLTTAAAALFRALRALESDSLDAIVVRLVPEHDLGVAINDRLRRAAHRG